MSHRLITLLTILLWGATSRVGAGVLGPEIVISALDNDQHMPVVAFAKGPDEYLVVWENEWGGGYHDIYAQRVSAEGVLLSYFSIASLPKSSFNPAVAYDPTRDRYLVVWSTESSTTSGDLDLLGRFIPRVAPDPSLTEFLIDSKTAIALYPNVEFGSSQDEFMVIWTKIYGFTPEVFGRRVAASGMGFPNSTFPIGDVTTGQGFSDLAYNPIRNEYLVTFSQLMGAMGEPWDIFAVRMAAGGGILGGGDFAVADMPGDDKGLPVVASCDGLDGYLVVWRNSQPDIYARFVTGDGVVDGPPIHIEDKMYRELWSDVTCSIDGSHYLVAWQSEYPNGFNGIWARAVLPNHSAETKFVVVHPTGTSGSTYPAVAAGGGGFMITWAHEREGTSYSDVHARTADPVLFYDGFESGSTSRWSSVAP